MLKNEGGYIPDRFFSIGQALPCALHVCLDMFHFP